MLFRRRSGGLAQLLLALVLLAAPATAAGARAATTGLDPGATASSNSARSWSRPAEANVKAGAAAGPRQKAKPPANPKPKPKPGWLVDRVRVEPLEPGGTVTVAHVGEYRGVVDIVPTPEGNAVAVVNEVGLEEYVRGLAEVPSSWPLEAQKAQAIAARTYALHELRLDPTVATAARAVGAQICATDACQVYTGVAKERSADFATTFTAWAAAVEQTKNEVVLFQDVPINAKYSSSNGGRSIAGGRPYLRVVDDPDDRFSPLHRWRSQMLGTDVAAALGLAGGVIEGLTRSGDLLAVDWRGPDGGTDRLTIHVNDFRARVNAAVLPPPGLPKPVPFPRFTPTADPTTNTVLLDGGGWGHGIGMSQWGAYGKALRGMKAADILAAYYGGLRPTKVDATKLPSTIRVAVDLGRPVVELATAGAPADAAVATAGPPAGATTLPKASSPQAATQRFRVLDQNGAPIAVAATGAWRFVPEGNRVRVLPPPGQEAVPSLEPMDVSPAAPTPEASVTVKVRLSTAALVRIAVIDATGATHATAEPRLSNPGDVVRTIPPLSAPGRYTVTLTADAGGGRTATMSIPIDVRPASAELIGPSVPQAKLARHSPDATPARPESTHDRNAAAALALMLLALVGAAAAKDRKRTTPTTIERLSSADPPST